MFVKNGHSTLWALDLSLFLWQGLLRGLPIEVAEFLDEMSLVVVSVVKINFMCLQTLSGRPGPQQFLKTNHFTDDFGRFAKVKMKQASELAWTQSSINVSDIKCAFPDQNFVHGA